VVTVEDKLMAASDESATSHNLQKEGARNAKEAVKRVKGGNALK
jgi:hypothetical protein